MDEGDNVKLTLHNDLGEGCVSVHTHGVHYPIESDGTLAQTNGVVDSCATVNEPLPMNGMQQVEPLAHGHTMTTHLVVH